MWESDQDRPEDLIMQEVGVWDVGLNQNRIHSWTQVRDHQFTQGHSSSVGDRTHLVFTA